MTVQQDLEDDDDAPLLYQPSTGSGKKSGLKGVKPIRPSATANLTTLPNPISALAAAFSRAAGGSAISGSRGAAR